MPGQLPAAPLSISSSDRAGRSADEHDITSTLATVRSGKHTLQYVAKYFIVGEGSWSVCVRIRKRPAVRKPNAMSPTAQNASTRSGAPSWTWVVVCLGALGLLALMQAIMGVKVDLAPWYALPVVLGGWFAGVPRGIAIACGALGVWLWGHPAEAVAGGIGPILGSVWSTALAYVALATLSSILRSTRERSLPDLTDSDCLSGVLAGPEFRRVVSDDLFCACRDSLPVACAYLELPGFRLLTEREGPATAIARLALLGRCMRRCLRRADTVGRLGAERFLVLLPGTAAAEASAVLERLHVEFGGATNTRDEGGTLRIVLLAYDRPPATFDHLVRDINAAVCASPSLR